MITTAIAAITAFIATTTFLWVSGILILILMAVLLENELEGWATTFFSLGIAIALWNFKDQIWGFISSNPSATIGFSVTYVLIGIAWSFIKWRSYVKNIFDRFKEIRLNFIRENGELKKGSNESFNKAISNKFKDENGHSIYIDSVQTLESIANKITPVASKKKSVITAWISYWPVSLAATILNNPFRKFFDWIYNNLSGYYDKITNTYKKDAFGI